MSAMCQTVIGRSPSKQLGNNEERNGTVSRGGYGHEETKGEMEGTGGTVRK